MVESAIGSLPASPLVMARRPDPLRAFAGLTAQGVAVISLFGWLKRWNDTLATPLEAALGAFAEERLPGRGWQAGRHG